MRCTIESWPFFGWLFLHDGKWKGKQIISRKWIDLATRKHMKMPHVGHYGYSWFPGSMRINGREVDYLLTSGYGGQTLYLLPEFDAIVQD